MDGAAAVRTGCSSCGSHVLTTQSLAQEGLEGIWDSNRPAGLPCWKSKDSWQSPGTRQEMEGGGGSLLSWGNREQGERSFVWGSPTPYCGTRVTCSADLVLQSHVQVGASGQSFLSVVLEVSHDGRGLLGRHILGP